MFLFAEERKKQHRFVLVPSHFHIRRLSNFMPIVFYSLSYALHVECSSFRFTVCSSSFTDGIFTEAVNADCRPPNRVSNRKKKKKKRKKTFELYAQSVLSAHVLAYNFPSFLSLLAFIRFYFAYFIFRWFLCLPAREAVYRNSILHCRCNISLLKILRKIITVKMIIIIIVIINSRLIEIDTTTEYAAIVAIGKWLCRQWRGWKWKWSFKTDHLSAQGIFIYLCSSGGLYLAIGTLSPSDSHGMNKIKIITEKECDTLQRGKYLGGRIRAMGK